MAARVSRCRSCGADVWWLEHVRTGRRAPIDVEPNAAGNVVVSLEDEQYRLAVPGDPQGERHSNHFATCPDAERWREGGA